MDAEIKSEVAPELYSIVIPVFNSTNSLIRLCEEIKLVFDGLEDKDYEIIFVDDHSKNPKTWIYLQNLRLKYDNVTIVKLTRNFGQHSAILCGFTFASGMYVITMDDDMQHPPQEILKLIGSKSHDVVVGRFEKKKHSTIKKLGSKLKQYIEVKTLKHPKDIHLSSFLLFKRSIVRNILKINSPFPLLGTYIFYVTSDVVNVNVEHSERMEGQSGYTMNRMVSLFSNLIYNNSILIPKAIRLSGYIFSVLSILGAMFFLYAWISKEYEIPDWLYVINSICFFAGILQISIGLIGEYLLRIISSVEKKDPYFIKEVEES